MKEPKTIERKGVKVDCNELGLRDIYKNYSGAATL